MRSIRSVQEVNSARMKFGCGPACLKCGKPTDGLSLICEFCLKNNIHADELKHTGEWLLRHPNTEIQIGWDKGKQIHLVMFQRSDAAWCGARVTQAMTSRQRLMPVLFPDHLCAACRSIYEGMAL
jgi:hypothetical protein